MTKGIPRGMIPLGSKRLFKSGNAIALIIPRHVVNNNKAEKGSEVEMFTNPDGDLLVRFK